MVNVEHNIFVRLHANFKNFNKGFNRMNRRLDRTSRHFQGISNKWARFGQRVALFTRRFQYWGLSIMFFGMQMQRTFIGIARAGVSTFTKVMESSGYFGSAIQQLGVHWEYLKFTIGSALNRVLEPLIPIIINIVNNIAKWIREHPRLTALLIAGGAALGTLFFFLGQIAITIGPLVKVFIGLGKVISWLAKGAFSLLGKAISAIISLISWLVANPITLMILAFITLSVIIALMVKKMGGFKEFFKSAFRGIARIVIWVSDIIITAFTSAWNVVMSLTIRAIDTINNLIMRINTAFGTNIGRISTTGLTKAMSDYQMGDLMSKYLEWEASGPLAPKLGYEPGKQSVYIENLNIETNKPEEFLEELKSYSVGGG